jgi:lipopolysaccharide export LptBFGC system permease protein LptF
MKVFEKFPFLMGLLASLFVLLSFLVKSPNSAMNQELAVMGILFGFAYWIWMIIYIRNGIRNSADKKTFWLVLAISAPYLGAMLYQIVYERGLLEHEEHEPARNEIAA